MKWIIYCLRHYTTVDRRAHRREFAWFSGALFLLNGLILTLFLNGFVLALPLGILLSVFLIIPTVCSLIRRLHDLNYSGWWSILFIILSFASLYSVALTLVLCLLPGSKGLNNYGLPPD